MSSSIRRETPRRTSKRRTGNAPEKRQIKRGGKLAAFRPLLICVWGLRRSSPTARRVSGGKPGSRTAFGAWKRRSTSGSRTAGGSRTSTIPAKPSRADAGAGRLTYRARRRKGAARKSGKEYLLHISIILNIHFTYFRIPGILEAAVQAHDRKLPETAERFEGFE